MLNELLNFLRDPTNQALLSWIGGGFVVVVGAMWAAFKFFISRKTAAPAENKPVSADRGSVVIARDNLNSPINVNQSQPRR